MTDYGTTPHSPIRGFARRFTTALVWGGLAAGIGLAAVGRVLVRDASSLVTNPIVLLDLLRQPLVLGALAAVVAMLAANAAIDEWSEVTARKAAATAAIGTEAAAGGSSAGRRKIGPKSVAEALAFVGLAALIFVFRPIAWGGDTSYAVVVGISMEPTMRTGDLAIVMRHDTYAVGDIVSYHPSAAPQGEIMHRIVGGDAATGWVTKGDHRPDADPDRSTTANIVGKVILHVPMAGYAVNSLRNPYVLGTLVALLVMAIAWDLFAKRSRSARR